MPVGVWVGTGYLLCSSPLHWIGNAGLIMHKWHKHIAHCTTDIYTMHNLKYNIIQVDFCKHNLVVYSNYNTLWNLCTNIKLGKPYAVHCFGFPLHRIALGGFAVVRVIWCLAAPIEIWEMEWRSAKIGTAAISLYWFAIFSFLFLWFFNIAFLKYNFGIYII